MHIPKNLRSALITISVILLIVITGTGFYVKNRTPYKEKLWQVYYYKVRLLLPLKMKPKEENFIYAVRKKDYDSVEALLRENGPGVIGSSILDGEPLKDAISSGDERMVSLMIASGMDPKWGLYYASKSGNTEMLKLLSASGGNLGDLLYSEQTCLHVAAHCGKEDTVYFLLKNGCPVNCKIEDQVTPLHLAANQGWTDCQSLYGLAIHGPFGNFPETVKELIKAGADANAQTSQGWTPLHIIADKGQIMQLKYEDSLDKTLEHEELIKTNLKIAEILIKNGADMEIKDKRGRTPLIVAIQSGNREIVDLLMKRGAKLYNFIGDNTPNSIVHPSNYSTLNSACAWGFDEIVEKLIREGANPNKKDEPGGNSSLHYAAFNPKDCAFKVKDDVPRSKLRIAKILLSHGAKVDIKGKDGSTPLFIAAGSGFKEMMDLLISRGANINARNEYGFTPLTYTRMSKQKEAVEYLKQIGAKE